jgi:hypothetical protein
MDYYRRVPIIRFLIIDLRPRGSEIKLYRIAMRLNEPWLEYGYRRIILDQAAFPECKFGKNY